MVWYNVIYFQDWFSEFDWDKAETSLDDYQDTINVLLVARSTPKIPLQELWTSRNYQKIQDAQRDIQIANETIDELTEEYNKLVEA